MRFHTLKTWLFPHRCILCSNLSDRPQDLCEACFQELPRPQNPCSICAIPLPETGSTLCPTCITFKPPYHKAHTLLMYEMPITRLILELKFKAALMHAKVLGELLAEQLPHWYKNKPFPTSLIPMPLHHQRLQERGFNQALEIARPVAKKLKIALHADDCLRKKMTLAQATLTKDERMKNVKNAFIIKKNWNNAHIAVIDDVMTTGSTMNEFCQTLAHNGAGLIDVWCVARPKML